MKTIYIPTTKEEIKESVKKNWKKVVGVVVGGAVLIGGGAFALSEIKKHQDTNEDEPAEVPELDSPDIIEETEEDDPEYGVYDENEDEESENGESA